MKILFLCNANMCRSPLAEGLLKLIFKERNIDATVDSAGFEAYHINDSLDSKVIHHALDAGIDISTKRVRLFSRNDFDNFDKIYVMDNLSYRNAVYFARDEKDIAKVDFLMNVVRPGRNEAVPDPYRRQPDSWDKAISVLREACEKIADSMTTEQLN